MKEYRHEDEYLAKLEKVILTDVAMKEKIIVRDRFVFCALELMNRRHRLSHGSSVGFSIVCSIFQLLSKDKENDHKLLSLLLVP